MACLFTRTAQRTAAALAATVFTATSAAAFTLDCTSGTGSFNGTSSQQGTVILAAGGSVTATQTSAPSFTMRIDGRTFAGGVQSGTALACQNSPGGMFDTPYAQGQGTCAGWTFTSATAGSFAVEPAHSEAGLVEWTLTCGAGMAAAALGVQTTAAQTAAAAQSSAAASQMSAGGQATAVGGAISSATGSRTGNGNGFSVSTQGFFLSTSGMTRDFDADWNGWVALGRRIYSGTGTSGASTALTLGVDRKLGAQSLVGLVVSLDRLDVSQGAISSTGDAVLIGPYFATRLGGSTYLDGYLAYGRADMTVGGGRFRANRTIAGLNIKSEFQRGRYQFTPFASIKGYRDAQPAHSVAAVAVAARNVSSVTGSLGGTVSVDIKLANQTLTPFASIAAEFNRSDNGLGTTSNFTSPRLSLGVTSSGKLGDIGFIVDGGKISGSVNDLGFSLSYTISF